MRMFVAAAALATLIASPAAAQSYHSSVGSGNIAHPYSATPYAPTIQQHHTVAPRAARQGRLYLYNGDTVRGARDPNLEFQLHRESQQGEW
jgi:hypothetical protein